MTPRRARRDDGDGDPGPWGAGHNGEHHARLAESPGMALPGNAPVRAGSEKMFDFARAAGGRIVEMVRENLRARDVLTPVAFANAVEVDLAVGGP